LTHAAGWTRGSGLNELDAPALLLGLLAETECRAAAMLLRYGVDEVAVRGRWPELTAITPPSDGPPTPPDRVSVDLQESLHVAQQQLRLSVDPAALATEHLLWGLVAVGHKVGLWLRERGLSADALQAEIQRVYGYDPTPLPLEASDEATGEVASQMAGETAGGLPVDTRGTGSSVGRFPADKCACPLPGGGGQSHFRGIRRENRDSPRESPRLHEFDSALPETPFPEQVGVLRVIDAAANRAGEGLRVVEDYVRFVLDDRHLTGRCKQLRHDLTAAMGGIPTPKRLAARETQADVGASLTTAAEASRKDAASIVTANLVRVQEGLRTLEEFAKILAPGVAALVKQLRYQTYTLERAVEITRGSIERLAGARLYVLLDGGSSEDEFRRLAGGLIDAGVHVLQLRDKRLDDRRLIDRARVLRDMTRRGGTLFVVNDRPDVAALSRADGVHVGQEELSVKDARAVVGPDALVGVSTHSIEQARQAVLDGANYIGVGPTFPSTTKQFKEFPGVALLGQVAAEIRLPAFAVGGVGPENLDRVLAAGFTRAAVGAAVTAADDPAAAVRRLLAGLRGVQ
jgi:thiamine-phosphate pyrophosphorylase